MNYEGHVICERAGKDIGCEVCQFAVPRKIHSITVNCIPGENYKLIPFTFQVGDVVEQIHCGDKAIIVSVEGERIGHKHDDSDDVSFLLGKDSFKFISRGGKMTKKEELTKKIGNFAENSTWKDIDNVMMEIRFFIDFDVVLRNHGCKGEDGAVSIFRDADSLKTLITIETYSKQNERLPAFKRGLIHLLDKISFPDKKAEEKASLRQELKELNEKIVSVNERINEL